MGLLLLLLPPAEVMLGIYLGRTVGAGWVLAALALGVVAGSLLIRLRGRMFFQQAMAAMQRQQVPTQEILGGIAWYVAGALLIFPGFITDVLAALVLLPPVRRRVLQRFRQRAEEQFVRMQGGAASFQWTPKGWQGRPGDFGAADGAGGDVFEGEGREIRDDDPKLPRPGARSDG